MLCPRPGLGPVLALKASLASLPCPCLSLGRTAGFWGGGGVLSSYAPVPSLASGRCKQLLNLPLVLCPPLSESLSLVSCLSLSPLAFSLSLSTSAPHSAFLLDSTFSVSLFLRLCVCPPLPPPSVSASPTPPPLLVSRLLEAA